MNFETLGALVFYIPPRMNIHWVHRCLLFLTTFRVLETLNF